MWFCAVIKIGIARIGCDDKCDALSPPEMEFVEKRKKKVESRLVG